jgi:hypothetical protein
MKTHRIFTLNRIGIAALMALAAFASPLLHAAEGVVHGTVRYEKIRDRHPTTGAAGLQVSTPEVRPVAGARVELVSESGETLAKTQTDAAGNYRLPWTGDPKVAFVRVHAAAENVVVVDYFDEKTIYSISTQPWKLPEGETRKDLIAKDADRASGPFNMLEAVSMGNRLLRSAEPNLRLPTATICWTTRHREGTSYFVRARNEICILGDRSVDSDEFDDCIVLHEYGHFVLANLSQDDSKGGSHSSDRLDPRVAWSEGWGSFFACAALGDSRYIDTGVDPVRGSGARVEYDVATLRTNGERIGFANEKTVARVLWGIFAGNQEKTRKALGFKPIWSILRSKAWAERPAYRTLLDFCDAFREANAQDAAPMRALLEANGIEWDGVSKLAAKYHRPLELGGTVLGEADSFGKDGRNDFAATVVFRFDLAKRTKVKFLLHILASKKKQADLDLYLYDQHGKRIAYSIDDNGVGGTETIERVLESGVYFLEVQSHNGRGSNAGSFRLEARIAQEVVQLK